MRVITLGTGSPTPTLERAGTAILVEIAGEPILVDAGPRVVYELMRNEVDPGAVERLFLTHHHMDHTLSFFHLALVGWTAGRESMTVFGPAGTDAFIHALHECWERDIRYRQEVGYDDSIEHIETVPVEAGFAHEAETFSVEALPVRHSIETYGYRFEATATGRTVVCSSDTAKFDGLVDFAAGADCLVMSCGLMPVGEPPETGFVWERYTEPYDEEKLETLKRVHVTPTQAGEVAAEARVDTLVLTHAVPYPDRERTVEQAEAAFDGEVVLADDGTTIDLD